MSFDVKFVIAPSRQLESFPDANVRLGAPGQMGETEVSPGNYRFYIETNDGTLRNIVHTSRNTSGIEGYQWNGGAINSPTYHGQQFFDSDSDLYFSDVAVRGLLRFQSDAAIENGRFYGFVEHYEEAQFAQTGLLKITDYASLEVTENGQIAVGYGGYLGTNAGSIAQFNGTVGFFGALGRDNAPYIYQATSSDSLATLGYRLGELQQVLAQFGLIILS